MRLVVAKDIIVNELVRRKVVWQKECLPDCQHLLLLFESASCKNSDTSCVRNQGANFYLFDGVPVQFIRNRYRCIRALFKFSCIAASTTKLFKIQNLTSSNPHRTQNFVVLYLYVLMHALPGIVDGARKSSQTGSWT